ncbi:MAG: 50S ribosomal protein L15 [Elusimicrobia bacterium]|nr:MAG: 50S ribosomal protein L15 [Elusimicrobiota bacterium]
MTENNVTISTLKPKHGARKRSMRVGKGDGSGKGRTCGKGQKGQTSRSGGGKGRNFEGGQVPLYMRMPKKGFTNARYKTAYQVVSLTDLERVFKNQKEVGLEALKVHGLIKGRLPVKVLGTGDLNKPLKVSAHAFSKTAEEKIKKAGGSTEILSKTGAKA